MMRTRGGEVIYTVTEQNLWDAWFDEGTSCGLDDRSR